MKILGFKSEIGLKFGPIDLSGSIIETHADTGSLSLVASRRTGLGNLVPHIPPLSIGKKHFQLTIRGPETDSSISIYQNCSRNPNCSFQASLDPNKDLPKGARVAFFIDSENNQPILNFQTITNTEDTVTLHIGPTLGGTIYIGS